MRTSGLRFRLLLACLPALSIADSMPSHADIGAATPSPATTSVPRFTQAYSDQTLLAVSPRTSTIGTPRTLFASGCTGNVVLDESAVGNGILVLRYTPAIAQCGQPPVTLSYTPRSVGRLRVLLQTGNGDTAAATEMETVTASHSLTNIDGMWYDPDTNGSGISFHHATGSDAVFGTWFMYGAQPTAGPRWFSLQNMQWQQGGVLLAGTAFQVSAQGRPACAAGDDCPRGASGSVPVGTVGFTLLDQNNARVEAFDWTGRSTFLSFLKRLSF